MKLLVDADSCPREARELVIRVSARRPGVRAVFAANRRIPGTKGRKNITMEICPPGDNSADDRLVELGEPGDLAVTRDLALAKRLLEKGITVIDDRGRNFTQDNINELLSIRLFTVAVAEAGLGRERIAGYDRKNLKEFADSLDRRLTKLEKSAQSVLPLPVNAPPDTVPPSPVTVNIPTDTANPARLP